LHEELLPKAIFGSEPSRDGRVVVTGVEAGSVTLHKVTASEVARLLGVTQ
jgi:hypothetical protein